MPPHSFRLEKSSGFCHPASIPTRPSFLGCHNWRQISGVLEGRWRFTESLRRPRQRTVSIRAWGYHGCLPDGHSSGVTGMSRPGRRPFFCPS